MGTNWEGQVKILPLHVFWTCRAEARMSIYLVSQGEEYQVYLWERVQCRVA